ncbi:MAG: hypothetical protein COZ20_04760 [Gallionellales bacterium CG_4_10_14_3_um_filter_54_96]|nr:DUF4124 domain-containing protein [Gallionella sp.]OIO82293.1 MAG: hypothetical protein AUJ88_02365 [Gallionellaceae bacterium CG1_02_56_997]PIV91722.1 MAG: hypothetical protein COW45_03875 [Gallionellales bacterium CG17_big_fil_post_rev_8_21_14_2_50_54_146]PIX05597.1 MAG: hypothetical protein COZ77_00355 [Gallionellales bacterium CG_4_8_14_3_um_filter_54_18]PIY04809.1 MAG: hypothetical protein COZ20_04760 [Gallionellales bacterium CG_4_10_14_3_um_filter_54_96]
MMKYNLLIILVISAAMSLPAAAKTFKWVDDQGRTHYGEIIPPEYANKDRQTLNKSGTVIKSQEVLTPEEHRIKEAESAKNNAEAATIRDQKRYDKSLTSTYSSVEEIELSRTRNIQQVDARINSLKTRLKMAQSSLLTLQKDANARTKSGQKIPSSLHDDITEAQSLMTRLQLDLDKQNADRLEVEKRFEADKARYKELTGK